MRVAVIIVLVAAVNCRSDIPEEDILDDLFYSYSKHARPSIGPGHTVKVSHSLTLTRIVNMEKHVLTADTWQMMKWQDNRLLWEPDDYNQVQYINIPDELIWTPDILLYNNAAATSGKTYASIRVVVDMQGHAVWIPATRVTAYCDEVTTPDRANVKVGDLKCPLKFGSWTYTEKDLNMTIDGEGLLMRDYIESPDYQIVDHNVTRHNLFYECCPDPYTAITYTIWLRRKCQQTVVSAQVCDKNSDVQGDEAPGGDDSDDSAQPQTGDDDPDDTDSHGTDDSGTDDTSDSSLDHGDTGGNDITEVNGKDDQHTDVDDGDTDDNTDDDDTDDNTDTNDDDADDTNDDDADDTNDDDNTDTVDDNEANIDDDDHDDHDDSQSVQDSDSSVEQSVDESVKPLVKT